MLFGEILQYFVIYEVHGLESRHCGPNLPVQARVWLSNRLGPHEHVAALQVHGYTKRIGMGLPLIWFLLAINPWLKTIHGK